MKKILFIVMILVAFVVSISAYSSEGISLRIYEYNSNNVEYDLDDYDIIYEYNYLIENETLEPIKYNLNEKIDVKYFDQQIALDENGNITLLKDNGGMVYISYYYNDVEIGQLKFYTSKKICNTSMNKLMMKVGSTISIDNFYYTCTDTTNVKVNKEEYKFEYDKDIVDISFDNDTLIIEAKKAGEIELKISKNNLEEVFNIFVYDNTYPSYLPDWFKLEMLDRIGDFETLYDYYHTINYKVVFTIYNVTYILRYPGIIYQSNDNNYIFTYDAKLEEYKFIEISKININEYENNKNEYSVIDDLCVDLYGLEKEDGYLWCLKLDEFFDNV